MSRSARWLGGACLVVATTAAAHGVDPSIVDVREAPNGRVDVRWTEPTGLIDGPGLQFTPTALRVDFPDHCRMASARTSESVPRGMETRWSLDCGSRGLRDGDIQVPGLLGSAKLVILRFRTARDREPRIAILTGRRDAFRLSAASDSVRSLRSRTSRGDDWRATAYLAAASVLGAIAMHRRRRGVLAWLLLVSSFWLASLLIPGVLLMLASDGSPGSIDWSLAAPGLAVLAAWCGRRISGPDPRERTKDAAARTFVLLVPLVIPVGTWWGRPAEPNWAMFALPVMMLVGALLALTTQSAPRLRLLLVYTAGIFAAIETALAITS